MSQLSPTDTHRSHANRKDIRKGSARPYSGRCDASIIPFPTFPSLILQPCVGVRRSRLVSVLLLIALIAFSGNLWGQITSGAIFGTVKDPNGAVVQGAVVTIKDSAIGFERTVKSGGEGNFVAVDLPAGTYTITVSASGFKLYAKEGVVLDVGARLSLGDFKLSVGSSTETITVAASGGQMQLQAASGERSAVIDSQQLTDLLSNGRNVLDDLKILAGINSTFNGADSNKGGLDSMNINGTRANEHLLTVDGISNEDNGNNGGVQVTVNTDAIAEVKVETSNYQAEYGKAAGGQIAVSIKNGTSAFHGDARYFYRHENMNANTWFNDQSNYYARQNGSALLPTNKFRHNDVGAQLGGPVIFPKSNFNANHDKLFFFYSQESYHQLEPGGTTQAYVPTNDERNGIFTSSTDGLGNAVVIKDPANGGQPFSDNQIPSGRIVGGIQQLMKLYPQPNTVDPTAGHNNYNYQIETAASHPRNEEIARVDWQINPGNRFFTRFIANQDHENDPLGNGGLYGTSNYKLGNGVSSSQPGYNVAFDLTTALGSSMVNEVTAGWSVATQQINSIGNAISNSATGISIPLVYAVPGSSPIPDISFTGRSQQQGSSDYNGALPFNTAQTVINLTDNLTKTLGRHTFKVGVFFERSRKDQSDWGNSNGQFSFSGLDQSQPMQTGDPYANALLGYYNTFGQSSTRPRGFFRYTSADFYLQDTWKVNSHLTLDYGMRFPWFQPQYDAKLQDVNFVASSYDPSQAVRIYQEWQNGNWYAYDPANPSVHVADYLKGTIVPGSGNAANGMQLARNGYYKGGFKDVGIVYEPRLGFAYDLKGNSKTIIRGGAAITHDRFQGNPIYNQVDDNPPNKYQATLQYGQVTDLGSVGSATLSPVTVVGFDPSGKLPTVYSYSLGIQRDLGKGTMLDVAYVGNLQRHLSQMVNQNYIPYGYCFTYAAQDPGNSSYGGQPVPTPEQGGEGSWLPSQYAGLPYLGDRVLPQNSMERYQGYSNVDHYTWDGVGNYNSLQVQLNRRFGHGLKFGGAYTFSKTMDTTDNDGSWINTISEKKYNYQLAGFDRPQILAVNYIYELPRFSAYLGHSHIVSLLTDNFEVSGISQFIKGTPGIIGLDLSWYQRLIDGSYSEPTRAYIKPGAKPSKGNGRYAAVDPTAFVMPNIGTPAPWPKQYLRGGGTNSTDLAVLKKIPVSSGEKRYVELRMEAFNAFNHPQFWGINLYAQPAVNDGSQGGNYWGFAWNWANVVPVNPNNIRPAGSKSNLGTYFGDYNSGGNPRIVQLAAKLYF